MADVPDILYESAPGTGPTGATPDCYSSANADNIGLCR